MKALARGKQIVINTAELSLTRWKKNLVNDQKIAHQYRYEQCLSILDDLQFRLITNQRQKREDRLTTIPKSKLSLSTIYTDSSEMHEGSKWGFLVKEMKRIAWKDKDSTEGIAQRAEVTALLKALEWAKEKGLEQINWVTDSEYCYNAVTEYLEVWEKNKFVTASKKPLEQEEEWITINKPLKGITVNSSHQVGHTKQNTVAAQGNTEVDSINIDSNLISN